MFRATLSAGLLSLAAASAPPASAQGDAAFAPCSTCHSLKAGVNGLGPSLAGVYGRKAASAPGFASSAALKAKGWTWTEAHLDAYLADPQGAVPGTKMAFQGYRDPTKRASVIAVLKRAK